MPTHILTSEWICVVSKRFCNIAEYEIPTDHWEIHLCSKNGGHMINLWVKLVCIILQARKETLPKASVTQRPEVVDDFVRNFLVKMKMYRTLDCFQTEWFAFQQFCISSRPMFMEATEIISIEKKRKKTVTTVWAYNPSNNLVHLCFQVRVGSEGRTQGRGCRYRTWYLCQEPAIGPRIKIHQIRNGKIQGGCAVSIEILSIPHDICDCFTATIWKISGTLADKIEFWFLSKFKKINCIIFISYAPCLFNINLILMYCCIFKESQRYVC